MGVTGRRGFPAPGESVTVALSGNRGRAVLVWLVALPPVGANFQATFAEAELRGAGSSPPPPSDQTLLARRSDDELARAAAAGERAALEVLLRRHQDLVWRVCRKLCANDADALDATQEALVAVARRIDRFDGRSAFTTWLYRVATNAALDELRRRRRRPEPMEELPTGAGGDAGTDHSGALADRMALDAAMAELAPDFRAPLVLRDIAGLDYAAIAETLDIPPGTVRSRIARARSQLAQLLAIDGNYEGQSRRQTPSDPAPSGDALP